MKHPEICAHLKWRFLLVASTSKLLQLRICPCNLKHPSCLVSPRTRSQRSWVVFQKQLHHSCWESWQPHPMCFQLRYVISSLIPLLSKTSLFLENIYGSNYRMANQTSPPLGNRMTFNPAQLCLVICLTVIIEDTLGCRDPLLQSERKQAVLELWHTSCMHILVTLRRARG